MNNPLKLKWLDKNMRQTKNSGKFVNDSLINERDYESLVIRKMRQVEERKRLQEQILKEDIDDND